jgi:exonuclease SbcD
MDWAADRMIEEQVNLCLFAGDAFKDSRVMLDRARVEIAAFLDWAERLCDAKIPLVVISGTPSHDSIDAYRLLRKMAGRDYKDYVRIVTEPGRVPIPDFWRKNYEGKVNIACLPGLNRSSVLRYEEFQGKPNRELHQAMTRMIETIAQGLLAESPPDCPTILLSHMTYSEAETGFDHLLLEHEPLLTPAAVEGYDLVCLGHIHRPQNIGGKVFYCGAPERHSFSDEHITPGFWIHALSNPSGFKGERVAVESRFIETPARRFVTLDTYGPGAYSHDVRDAVVRVRAAATEGAVETPDRKGIEKNLYEAGAFFVSEISIDEGRPRQDRSRDETVTESLAPVEALAKWSEQQGISEDEIRELIGMAKDLMAEEAV